MKPRALSAAGAFALLLVTGTSFAQGGAPIQLRWQAPANCPQEAQVRQKLRELLGSNASDVAASRLRAEGQIEQTGERFRLTLNIHYDLVNGTRVVQASTCEDLGGVAAVTLALLFRAEHSSNAPLTARDLGGPSASVVGDGRTAGTESQTQGSETHSANEADRAAQEQNSALETRNESEKPKPVEPVRASESRASESSHWRFVLSAPELRTDIGVLPDASYGIGLGAGARHEAWRFLLAGTWWLAQDDEPGSFVGYGAHFARLSGELSACHGFRVAGFELAPCLLITLDDVAARGTGVGVSSSNPHTAWLSVGAGLQGLWPLGSRAALVFGVNGRAATSRPRFVSEGVGEISQVGPAALGSVLGCQWLL